MSSPRQPTPTPSLSLCTPRGPRPWARPVMWGGWKSQFCGAACPEPACADRWMTGFPGPSGLSRGRLEPGGGWAPPEEGEEASPYPCTLLTNSQGTKGTRPHSLRGRMGFQGLLRAWRKDGQGGQGRGGLGSWGSVRKPECPLISGRKLVACAWQRWK